MLHLPRAGIGFVMLCAACSNSPPRLPSDLIVSIHGSRIQYEKGAEAQAKTLAELLPHAIHKVESRHHKKFREPVEIHICASEACFSSYVKTPRLSAAVVTGNRLILNPHLFSEERDRLPFILTHELSHIHFGQQLGHFDSAIPVWFHEGFATWVASGGGADSVTDTAAWEAVKKGDYFFPQQRHSAHIRKYAQDWNLPIHVFYRQAMLFIQYLHDVDSAAFRTFVLDLQEAEQFYLAFSKAYGQDFAAVAANFRP